MSVWTTLLLHYVPVCEQLRLCSLCLFANFQCFLTLICIQCDQPLSSYLLCFVKIYVYTNECDYFSWIFFLKFPVSCTKRKTEMFSFLVGVDDSTLILNSLIAGYKETSSQTICSRWFLKIGYSPIDRSNFHINISLVSASTTYGSACSAHSPRSS